MRTFLNKIVNIILPERDSHRIVRELDRLIAAPKTISLNGCTVHYLLEFKHRSVRACIHEAKFHNNIKAQNLLGQTVSDFLKLHSISYDVVIPLTLSTERLKQRGYNQVEEILKSARIQHSSKIIMRADRPTQTSLTREERLKNVTGSFSIHTEKALVIAGKHILLVDDVVTTGATLRAAKAALLPHQPTSVTCLALAH